MIHSLAVVLGIMPLAGACGPNASEQEAAAESVGIVLARETVEGDYRLVTAAELQEALATGEDMLLVDARLAASFEDEHLPGAVHFPFPIEPMGEWIASETGGRSAEDFADLLGPDQERSIVFYCGFLACTRSHNGALWARKLGYRNVWRFPGGIRAWEGAGFDTASD